MERAVLEQTALAVMAPFAVLVAFVWLVGLVLEWHAGHELGGALGALVIACWLVGRLAHGRGRHVSPWLAVAIVTIAVGATSFRPAPLAPRVEAPAPELSCSPERTLPTESGVWRARAIEREGSLFPRDVVWERHGPTGVVERLDSPRGFGASGVCRGHAGLALEYARRITDAPPVLAPGGPTSEPRYYVPLDEAGRRADDGLLERFGRRITWWVVALAVTAEALAAWATRRSATVAVLAMEAASIAALALLAVD